VTGYTYQHYGPALSFNMFTTLMTFGAVCAFVSIGRVKKGDWQE